MRWKVKAEDEQEEEVKDEQEEHEGTIWGWLPADESDYFPEEPEEEGGQPGPLWRVHFSDDKISSADLDEEDIKEALKMHSSWSQSRAEKDLSQDDGKDKSAARMSVDSSEFRDVVALNDDGTVLHSH